MSKKNVSAEDLTDGFDVALHAKKEPTVPKLNISPKTKKGLAVASVLLGGAAFAFTSVDESGVAIAPSTENDGVAPADSTQVAAGQQVQVTGGSLNPNDDIEIASNVNDEMSFADAYAAAREEVGAGGVFSWNGNVYNTFTKEEWQGMSLEQKQEFLQDVGFKPEIKPEPVDPVEPVKPEPVDPVEPEPEDPSIYEIEIDGVQVIVIDEDNDGNADALVKVDDEGNVMALLNMDGEEGLEVSAMLDPITGEIIASFELDEPIYADVEDLLALDEGLLYDNGSEIIEEPIDEEAAKLSEEDDEVDDIDHISMGDDFDNDADISDLV